ncbi:MAG: zinc-dependent metalloprotease [Saprospiraceae bacterium]|nr:zinc-dependent metalloprotease [Saprospiraceae bacterium]
MKKLLMIIVGAVSFWLNAASQEKVDLEKLQKHTGFIDFYWDDALGKLYLDIKSFNQEFLYNSGLAAGIGSNDIGLDRGQLGSEYVVTFVKVGNKILLKAKNLDYRANSDNPLERRAVEEAFAESVLWGFIVMQQTSSGFLVDATKFIVRDAHGVVHRLTSTNQGAFQMDDSRSAIYLPRTKNFPKNSEFEATITLTGEAKGRLITTVVPDPDAVTVRQHHSFIELPDLDYKPRIFDPRCGYFPMTYFDYASAINEPIEKRLISRHRLKKKDPSVAVSEAVEPIIYYMDSGAPEPVKSALMEGAAWWNQAFEAAGYKDAFQVKVMPTDADPMDVRYNLIQWVHRSTRGWSYGSSVIDPRTGEIIKGHVSLGSLRVRQDYLIAQGLDAPFREGKSDAPLVNMALARLRQLAAHEVGHTLGLAHNFAASTNDRSSVMDYPHPYVEIDDQGNTDFSKAYDVNIGEWDVRAILYGYQDFPEHIEEYDALQKMLQKNEEMGLRYISDQDARPIDGAHPYAHLWDEGSSPVEELDRMLSVRKKALERFGIDNIPHTTPIADLERILVPLYLSHRYQVEAVSKMVGGVDYTYAVKGNKEVRTKMISPEQQEAAIDGLLKTLDPEILTLPESIISLIPPVPAGYERDRELFKIRTGLTFDPIGAAESAASWTLRLMLNPQRMSRIFEQNARNGNRISVEEYLDIISTTTRKYLTANQGLQGAIAEVVHMQFVHYLLRLTADESMHHQVAGAARALLQEYQLGISESGRSHALAVIALIKQFIDNPAIFKIADELDLPDGSPIGCSAMF